MRITSKHLFIVHAAIFAAGFLVGAAAVVDTYEEPIRYPKKLRVYQGGKKR